jgi:cytochrome b subunit of formate dehydrogenase
MKQHRRRIRTGYIVIRTLRFTSWFLLALVLTYITTGYVMSGQLTFGGWADPRTALAIHRLLHVPLMVVFGLHALGGIYLAMRRKRWIRW